MKKRSLLYPQHWLGFTLAILFLLVAVFAPIMSTESAKTPGSFKRIGRPTDFKPHAPNENALLGTAPQQYDIYHSIVWGTADAIKFSLGVVGIAALFGMLVGILSAYFGGWANSLLMRITDAFLTIPLIVGVVFIQQLVMVSIVALTEDFSIQMWSLGRPQEFVTNPFIDFFTKTDPMLVAFILLSWMPYARLMNTIILEIKENEFIMATRALGAGPLRVIFKHLLPNAYGSMLIMASRDMGNIVIMQATITFLGLGGNSTWGELLAMGRDWVIGPGGRMFDYWWVYLPVTIVVVVFGITWNLVGEGLQHLFRLERE